MKTGVKPCSTKLWTRVVYGRETRRKTKSWGTRLGSDLRHMLLTVVEDGEKVDVMLVGGKGGLIRNNRQHGKKWPM